MPPTSHCGRFITISNIWFCLMGVSILGAVITSKFVVGALSVSSINSLADVTGVTCTTFGYIPMCLPAGPAPCPGPLAPVAR